MPPLTQISEDKVLKFDDISHQAITTRPFSPGVSQHNRNTNLATTGGTESTTRVVWSFLSDTEDAYEYPVITGKPFSSNTVASVLGSMSFLFHSFIQFA
jgi:hypothetical protein